MAADAFLWTGSAAGAGSVLLLRHAWGRGVRSIAANALAWGLLGVALVCGAATAGAWGMSVVSIVAILTAFAMLAIAAVRTPAGLVRPAPLRVAGHAGHAPKRIGSRFATFLVCVPLGLVVSLLMSIALRALLDIGGAGAADSNAAALFVMPVAWAVLVSLLLIWPARRSQLAMLLVPGLLSAAVVALVAPL